MSEDIYKKLVVFLKLFNNRPHHLAKFLLESDALTLEFINVVKGFNEMTYEEKFNNITEINDYFNRFLTQENSKSREEKMEQDLNIKLDFLISEERYEDAARVRDYMIKNKIKINKS